jgi:hypothetical protein
MMVLDIFNQSPVLRENHITHLGLPHRVEATNVRTSLDQDHPFHSLSIGVQNFFAIHIMDKAIVKRPLTDFRIGGLLEI